MNDIRSPAIMDLKTYLAAYSGELTDSECT